MYWRVYAECECAKSFLDREQLLDTTLPEVSRFTIIMDAYRTVHGVIGVCVVTCRP